MFPKCVKDTITKTQAFLNKHRYLKQAKEKKFNQFLVFPKAKYFAYMTLWANVNYNSSLIGTSVGVGGIGTGIIGGVEVGSGEPATTNLASSSSAKYFA